MSVKDSPGRAFVFGDNIDTDVLAPGSLMKLEPHDLAMHCLAAIDPTFACVSTLSGSVSLTRSED